jgi:hypothetical protein
MSPNESEAQLQIDAAVKRMRALYVQGQYKEALDICLQLVRTDPNLWGAWSRAALNCLYLARWQEAIRYAQAALTHGGSDLMIFDVLAHAYSEVGQWDEARRYGLQALEMHANRFNGAPVIPLPEPGSLPPPPSAQTRQRNIIAFSLFGGDPKYCETAVLNVQEQPDIYPDWVCQFYVDASVPEHVIYRLQAGGAQIVRVEGTALQWPGPMWRFLALDDPQAHRILFRDADSVISRREAGAVAQWITSGKWFHMMRDWGSHTELMMAGLWGTVAGSLPPLDKLMERFMSAPLESRHFADQYFLRQYVWPYARMSLMQHDSVFGFMDGVPFPDGARPKDKSHIVSYSEDFLSFVVKNDLPDESKIILEIYITKKYNEEHVFDNMICSYPGVVKSGVVKAYIPRRYAQWIRQGTACIRVVKDCTP